MAILRPVLEPFRGQGHVLFEFSIPRLGKRIDVVAVIQHVLFVIEFKVGEKRFFSSATDQVWDYGLDLKNFHETTHDAIVVPILVATHAEPVTYAFKGSVHNDKLLAPIHVTPRDLADAFRAALHAIHGPAIDARSWEAGQYRPTPTSIEAAIALYGGHSVDEISRSDAGAINLTRTSNAVSEVIRKARATSTKAICFVTGVPGAGKTLVGLDIATKHIDKNSELYSVFLSGNGPLVAVLREALAPSTATPNTTSNADSASDSPHETTAPAAASASTCCAARLPTGRGRTWCLSRGPAPGRHSPPLRAR